MRNGKIIKILVKNLQGINGVTHDKACVYLEEKACFFIVNKKCYCKVLPETTAILGETCLMGKPYDTSYDCYIINVENKELMQTLARLLVKVMPLYKVGILKK